MPRVARLPKWDRVPGNGAGPRAASVHPLKYYAFLSYSHADATTADWLHDALERFRTPGALAGRLTQNGVIPRHLTPIFRDRHELPASQDLGRDIRDALDSSRFLIVLCSPAAAASQWVNAEIDMFKRHRPDGCVLAAIISGEPFASDMPGREGEECLPAALRHRYDRRGRPTARPAEPLAADLRDHRDGKRLGLLKLIAGMLGVGLDELVQRETLRRQRRLAIVAAASLAGMAVTSTLAIFALDSRDEARDQRREAEGLVGFMLGDLRSKLEPLGRLDVLDSVGARALAYYQSQDKSSLSDDALAQRSKALTLMGEIANTRGNLDSALRLYREALAGTAESLRREPDNAQRVFDHAQNVFWVGYIAWQRGRTSEAEAAFQNYKHLADQMIALEPGKRQWQLEGIYADMNLGTLLLDQHRYREAASAFQVSLGPVETMASAEPKNLVVQKQLSETLGYLSLALEQSGNLDDALAQRERQLALIVQLQRSNPEDMALNAQLVPAERSMGRLLASRGELAEGIKHATVARDLSEQLFRTEPDNTEWMQWGAYARLDLAELQLGAGDFAAASASTRSGCDAARRLLQRDRSVATWRIRLQVKCLQLRSTLALRAGSQQEALETARRAAQVARGETRQPDRSFALASTFLQIGDVYQSLGQPKDAQAAWGQARAFWPQRAEAMPRQLAELAVLEARLGHRDVANRIAERLQAVGYRYPAYLDSLKNGGRA